jgi:hypothetical protein
MNTPHCSPRWPLLLLVGLLANWHAVAAPDPEDEFHETYPLAKDGRVQLDNLNGDVRVVTWDRQEVKVDARKRAKQPELLEQVQIEVDASPDRVRIKTRYPEGQQTKGQQASVDYTLTVPRQCRLDGIKNVNGNVRIEAVNGEIKASTVNGKLEATQLADEADLSSVNGPLRATFASLKGGVSLKTVNGPLTLGLPADADATVKASTVNGSIHTDFPLEVKGHAPVGRNLDGQLGQGTARIKMSSVNGPIKLVKE